MKTSIILLTSLMLLFSCTEQLLDDETVTPPKANTVRLELITNAGEYTLPETRTGSANEEGIDLNPWVIVFKGTDANALFSEAVQSVQSGSKTYVGLTESTSACRVLILANTPTTFFNGSSEVPFNAANMTAFFASAGDYATALNRMETASLASPEQPFVPYAGLVDPLPLIPMSAYVTLPKIDTNTSLGTVTDKIVLTRIVAKVTVESSDASFVVLGATVVNAPRSGRFVNTGTLKDNTGSMTDYLAATGDQVTDIAAGVGNSTATNPIYLYESHAVDKPCVIIKAEYKEKAYYYPLIFKGTTDGTSMDVLRNKHYRFIITSVGSAGFATVAEAKASLESNISYEIKVTDQTSYEIDDNGQYYLGLSNSTYSVCTNEVDVSILAFTITTNAPVGTSNSIAVRTNNSNISLHQTTINLASTPGEIATTDVRISIPNPDPKLNTISVELGNLSETVVVEKQSYWATAPIGLGNFVSATVTQGSSWLSVSSNTGIGSDQIQYSVPGMIYIVPQLATSGTNQYGEVFLSSGSTGGRVRIFIKQPISSVVTP